MQANTVKDSKAPIDLVAAAAALEAKQATAPLTRPNGQITGVLPPRKKAPVDPFMKKKPKRK
jgi:hypothetical protein